MHYRSDRAPTSGAPPTLKNCQPIHLRRGYDRLIGAVHYRWQARSRQRRPTPSTADGNSSTASSRQTLIFSTPTGRSTFKQQFTIRQRPFQRLIPSASAPKRSSPPSTGPNLWPINIGMPAAGHHQQVVAHLHSSHPIIHRTQIAQLDFDHPRRRASDPSGSIPIQIWAAASMADPRPAGSNDTSKQRADGRTSPAAGPSRARTATHRVGSVFQSNTKVIHCAINPNRPHFPSASWQQSSVCPTQRVSIGYGCFSITNWLRKELLLEYGCNLSHL
ncbi:hypothetical protein ACLOJK_034518 [Asimina triloba]